MQIRKDLHACFLILAKGPKLKNGNPAQGQGDP